VDVRTVAELYEATRAPRRATRSRPDGCSNRSWPRTATHAPRGDSASFTARALAARRTRGGGRLVPARRWPKPCRRRTIPAPPGRPPGGAAAHRRPPGQRRRLTGGSDDRHRPRTV